MSKKPNKQQLIERVAGLAIEFNRAHFVVTCLRTQLNREYWDYFRAHGEPYPDRHGIDRSDPAYDGAVNYTRQACERLRKGKRDRYNVKRRFDTAVRALMDATGEIFTEPKPATMKRATMSGETLQ